MLLVSAVELLEGVCAFAIITSIDNERRLNPITENKNINIAHVFLPLINSFSIAYLLYAFHEQYTIQTFYSEIFTVFLLLS